MTMHCLAMFAATGGVKLAPLGVLLEPAKNAQEFSPTKIQAIYRAKILRKYNIRPCNRGKKMQSARNNKEQREKQAETIQKQCTRGRVFVVKYNENRLAPVHRRLRNKNARRCEAPGASPIIAFLPCRRPARDRQVKTLAFPVIHT
jgi:hypothetical protein